MSEHRRGDKVELEYTIKSSRRAALIVNTRSRKGAKMYQHAKKMLVERGLMLCEEHPVSDSTRIPQIVKYLIRRGHKLILIGGGDGTISSVMGYFAYQNAVLGILPLGTANSFARTLCVPLSLEGAIDTIVNGKVADIDLGKINGRYFANTVSIGLPPLVGEKIPSVLKRYLGPLAYIVYGTLEFFRYQPFRCSIAYGGTTINADALDILLANGQYQGAFRLAAEADVEDRHILLRIVEGTSKWNVLKWWLNVLAYGSTQSRLAFVRTIRAQEIQLHATPRQVVSVDGEVGVQTPIHVSVAKEALKLMVPLCFNDRDEQNAGE